MSGLRVIGGELGGRVLRAPRGQTTRPTAARVREALFSILGDVSELRVLDLYAGTGALGIEALSRGAMHATFVESDRSALVCLRENLGALDLQTRSEVLPVRVTAAQSALGKRTPFDLVLCDPPWRDVELAAGELARLVDQGAISADGRVVIEHAARGEHPKPAGLFAYDQRIWGDTAATLFKRTLAKPGEAPL